jgi:hypothetical protein
MIRAAQQSIVFSGSGSILSIGDPAGVQGGGGGGPVLSTGDPAGVAEEGRRLPPTITATGKNLLSMKSYSPLVPGTGGTTAPDRLKAELRTGDEQLPVLSFFRPMLFGAGPLRMCKAPGEIAISCS